MHIITYIELSASPLKNLALSLNLRRLKKRTLALGYSLIIYKKEDVQRFADYRGHQTSPYSFKPFCMRLAQEAGYQNVLWLDGSIYPSTQSLEFIDAAIKRDGYFLMQDTNPDHGQYYLTNDRTLRAYKVSRDKIRSSLALLSGVVGLDLKSDQGVAILDEWALAERNGLFEGCHHNKKFTESPLAEVIGHRP